MIHIDIPADLNDEDDEDDEDETGYVWTFLDKAEDPTLIWPGAIVVTGDPDSPAVAAVIDLLKKPAGTIVHLSLLPGSIEDYRRAVQRALAST